MLVTKRNFDHFLIEISKEKKLAFDTETTRVAWWDSPHYPEKSARVFAAQFSSGNADYYLDFNHSDDRLGDGAWVRLQAELFSNPDLYWFAHNFKFDLHHSRNHGADFKGKVHCTKAIQRVVNNLEPKLGLDALSEKYFGAGKDDLIAHLKEKGHVSKVKRWGRNEDFEEQLHFDRADLDILIKYGEKDTRLCYQLGEWQLEQVKKADALLSNPPYEGRGLSLSQVVDNEMALTKILFDMERVGVKIDREYTLKAYNHDVDSYLGYKALLDSLAAKHVSEPINWNSAKQLKPLFIALNEPYGYTEKGNACFDKESLEESNSELAQTILKYRYHYKRAHTYFENYIWLADCDDVLHADAQQGGTETGRMSYWTPNLQNVPKRSDKDDAEYRVRKCFIPRPGFFFADFDYDGAEYFLMLDYAKETALIEKVKAGLDVHVATQQELGIGDRDSAKTTNFGILYGMGIKALAAKLKVSFNEGRDKREQYFGKFPRVWNFIDNVKRTASDRGFIVNWLGRILQYDRSTNYKAPNGLCQSGVGDLGKVAMRRCAEKVLTDKESRMLLPVHDAILFEVSFKEHEILPQIKEEMERAYPFKLLPMRVSGAYSLKSWGDLQDELPELPLN